MPDCHGVTENDTGSSSLSSDAFVLVVMTSELVWRQHGQCQDERFAVTHPEGQVSLHFQPYRKICRNCENIQYAWDGLWQDTIRKLYNSMLTSVMLHKQTWQPGTILRGTTSVCVAQ